MKKPLTIYAGVVKELYYKAIQGGASTTLLAQMTGLTPEHFNDIDARIPAKQLVSLWQAAIKLTGNMAIGLHIGEQPPQDDLGIVSLFIMNSPHLGEAIARAIRYIHLIAESDHLAIKEKDEHIHLTYTIDAPEYLNMHGVERMFASIITWSRLFSGVELKPVAAHFQHAAPEYIADYERIFLCPLFFERTNNTIVFDKSVLQLPAQKYNAYQDELFRHTADSLLKNIEDHCSVFQQVQRLIVANITDGNMNIDTISAQLNMSRRTLARKLKDEGTTFQNLVGKTKTNLAQHYLTSTKHSINDIAFILGFSEASSFSRAFKRWCGSNPHCYRYGLKN